MAAVEPTQDKAEFKLRPAKREALEAIDPDVYRRWRSTLLGRITDRIEERLILKLAGDVTDRRVLDVGCGDGALALALVARGAIVTGVDADRRMIAVAQTRFEAASRPIDLVEADARNLPFPDACFDLVIAVTVLCFIQDAMGAVHEMARVLKPGGTLVIGELGRWSPWAFWRRLRGRLGARTWRNARFHSAAELRRLMVRAGLRVRGVRGAIYYPPCGFAAWLMEGVDDCLGRISTVGAAFIAVGAGKPTLPLQGSSSPHEVGSSRSCA
jgi:ubiquinone/menaquinone biosynthesis C-methylase UbiE